MKNVKSIIFSLICIIFLFTSFADAGIIYSTDFESGNDGFDPQGFWEWGSPIYPNAASGNKCMGTRIQGNYFNDMYDLLILTNIDLSLYTNASLEFNIFFEVQCDNDGGDLLITTNDWATTNKLGIQNDFFYDNWNIDWDTNMGWSCGSDGWKNKELDISEYVGSSNVDIAFRFVSDAFDNWGVGMYIDDFIIRDTRPSVAGSGGIGWMSGAYINQTNTWEFIFITEFNMGDGSRLSIDIPDGWSEPQINNPADPGYIEVVPRYWITTPPKFNSVPQIIGNRIVVYITNMERLEKHEIAIRYGAGFGAITPSIPDNYKFVTKTAGPGQSLANIDEDKQPFIKIEKIFYPPFTENFETTGTGWLQDGDFFQWEWGIPSSGPTNAYSGSKCWGTKLNGNYQNTRAREYLNSPPIDLTGITNVYLHFYQYFDTYDDDYAWDDDRCKVYVRTNDWDWIDVGVYPADYNSIIENQWGTNYYWCGNSGGWKETSINLNEFAGSKIYLIFELYTEGFASTGMPGWYIDNVSIFTGLVPAAGTGRAAVNQEYIIESMNFNYRFDFIADEVIQDGQVEITIPADWTPPQIAPGPGQVFISSMDLGVKANTTPVSISGAGPWTVAFDITNVNVSSGFEIRYDTATASSTKGSNIFTFKSAGDGETLTEISKSPSVFIIPILNTFPYSESFESGGGDFVAIQPAPWWEVGTPQNVGPTNAYDGTECWGTVIDGNYPKWDEQSNDYEFQLYSPAFDLSSVTNAYIEFAYYVDSYTYYHDENDWSTVGAQVLMTTNYMNYFILGTYPDFYNTKNFYSTNSAGQTNPGITGDESGGPGSFETWEKVVFDLTPYIGKEVMFQFKFVAWNNHNNNSAGFYIDDVKIGNTALPYAGTGKVILTPGIVKPSQTKDFTFSYHAKKSFYGGEVSLQIPANWQQPQTSVPGNPGYISVSSVTNAVIDTNNIQITNSGPWTITITVTNMAEDGIFDIHYNNVKALGTPGSSQFRVRTKLFSETFQDITTHPEISIMTTVSNFPYNEDFETDNGSFAQGNSFGPLWDWGDPVELTLTFGGMSLVTAPENAASGTKCWGTDIDGDYPINPSTIPQYYNLYSPFLNFSNHSKGYLEFYVFHVIEGDESGKNPGAGAQVLISTNSYPFEVIGSYPGVYTITNVWDDDLGKYTDGWTMFSGGWKKFVLDLTPYAGKEFQINFRFLNYDTDMPDIGGIYIDNITIGTNLPYIAGTGNTVTAPQAVAPLIMEDFTFQYKSEYDFYPGKVTLTIPETWTEPQTAASNDNGYVTIAAFGSVIDTNLQITGTGPWTITVNVTNIPAATGFELYYENVPVPNILGATVFTMKSALNNEVLTPLSQSPDIYVLEEKVPPFTEDFETDNGGLVGVSSTHYKWEWGIPSWGPSSAYSGNKCWGTDLDDNYNDTYISDNLYTPIIDMTSMTQASIIFYHWYDISEEWNSGINLSISTNFSDFEVLGTYPKDYNEEEGFDWDEEHKNEPCWIESSAGWVKKSFNLTPYAGKKIILRFHFGSGFVGFELPGWYIDKVQFLDTLPPVAGTGDLSISPSFSIAGDTSQSYNFIFSPVDTMAAGSKVRISFSNIWIAPDVNNNNVVFHSPINITNVYGTSGNFNYVETTFKEALPFGSSYTCVYTNVNNLSTPGTYKFYVKTAGPGETLTSIPDPGTISLQEIQSLPYSEDFEYNNGTWDTYGSQNNLWEWGTPSAVGPSSAKSGSKCWGTVIDNNYRKSRTVEFLITPPINLTSETQAFLTFHHYYDTEYDPLWGDGDGGILEVSYGSTVDSLGQFWEQVGNADDYNINNQTYWGDSYNNNNNNLEPKMFWGDSSMGWLKKNFNLSAYAGYYIKLRFSFGTDYEWANKPGWYIDNIKIEGTAPLPPTVLYEDSGTGYGERSSAGIAFGDIDNDGDFDMIENDYSESYNIVWKNDSGVYQQTTSMGNASTYHMLLADFNMDGYLDSFLGTSTEDGDKEVNKIYVNNGHGVLYLKQDIGNNTTKGLTMGDYDMDGDTDVFVANYGANDLLLNNGNGFFTATSALLPEGTTACAASGDIDNDGDIDIILGNYDEISLILLNDGYGNFSQSSNLLGKYNVLSIELADINEDAYLDIIFGNSGVNYIWTNNGAGKFTALSGNVFQIRNISDLSNETYDIKAADANNDGMLDIFCGNHLAPDRIWLNQGNKVFRDTRNELGNYASMHISLADVDRDGDLDFGVGNFRAQPNRIWLNKSTNTNQANTKPDPPTQISAVFTSNELTVQWDNGSDTETSQNLLTYNLRVGTTENGNEIMSVPGGDNPDYLSTRGNVGHHNQCKIRNINDISYFYIYVQTVDSGLRCSDWISTRTYYDPLSDKTNELIIWQNYVNPKQGDKVVIINTFEDLSKLTLKIYAFDGAPVKTIVDTGTVETGNYDSVTDTFLWFGKNNGKSYVGPGMYWVVSEYDNEYKRKCVLVIR